MNFQNPWSDHNTFVDLGEYNVGYRNDDGSWDKLLRDLYAIEHLGEGYVDLGCRYSSTDNDYASGYASRNIDAAGKAWVINGGPDIQAAAARYFANHHPEIKS